MDIVWEERIEFVGGVAEGDGCEGSGSLVSCTDEHNYAVAPTGHTCSIDGDYPVSLQRSHGDASQALAVESNRRVGLKIVSQDGKTLAIADRYGRHGADARDVFGDNDQRDRYSGWEDMNRLVLVDNFEKGWGGESNRV